MTFEDVPDDWPTRPLSDQVLAADLLDLCITDQDRMKGGLSLLLCRRDDTLAQPVFVGDIPRPDELWFTMERTLEITAEVPEAAAVVVALVRHWGTVTDADRALHQHAIEVCGRTGIRLLGTFLVTSAGVTPLPVASALLSRHGAA